MDEIIVWKADREFYNGGCHVVTAWARWSTSWPPCVSPDVMSYDAWSSCLSLDSLKCTPYDKDLGANGLLQKWSWKAPLRGRRRRKPIKSELMSGHHLHNWGPVPLGILWKAAKCQEPPRRGQEAGVLSRQLTPCFGPRLLLRQSLPCSSLDQKLPSGCKTQEGVGLSCP